MNATSGKRRRPRRSPLRRAVWLLVSTIVIFVASEVALKCNRKVYNYSTCNLTDVITPGDVPQEVVEYTGMTVSFNPVEHIPNWVAYELTADEVQGTVTRSDAFTCDPSVKGCPTPDDYKHSGFDRGHMAPAADMKWSDGAMEESFYMTNIAPQVKSLNRGSWSKLEDKCRQRALTDSAIIIVTGPVLIEEPLAHIGKSGVTVPSAFFKVILSPHATPPSAIGFIFPNGTIVGGMQKCAVSVDSVESLTGLDFFSALPDEIEDEVESRCNFDRWSRMK